DGLKAEGVFVHVISDKLGVVTGANGRELPVDATFITTHPTLFDAYYVVGGTSQNQTMFDEQVKEYLRKAYQFFKPIGVATTGTQYAQLLDDSRNLVGVVMADQESQFGTRFVEAITTQRFWDRV